MWGATSRRVYPGGGMSYPYQNGGGPSTMDGYGSMYGSFAFKKRFERIDWKKIASTDIDSISRNLDFNALQDNIMNITFCNIESEVDIRMMDPNFVKLFKLAQLTIEYLLHSQDYLSSMVGTLENKLKKAVQEHEETKKSLEKSQTELGEVKKECHKRKKMLMAQQQILQAGANAYNKCPYCSKAFINVTFLQSHLARRHPEHVGQSPYSSMPPQHIVPPGESQGQVNVEKNEQLEREMNEIKERLRLTESQLVEERNARNSQEKQGQAEDVRMKRDRKDEIDRWKEEQHEQHQTEMEEMREMFMKELREMNGKYNAQSSVVEKLQSKVSGKSLLGNLEDDMRHEKDELRKQREEVAVLKEELQGQVKSMDLQLQGQLKDKDKKWQDKMKKMEKQHQMQIEELSDALEQSVQDIEKDEVQVRVQYQRNLKEAHDVLEHSNEIEQVHIEQERQTKLGQQQRNEAETQAIKDQVQKATSPRPNMGRMDPPSDDETTEMKEATLTMDTAGPSTLRTLMGTGSLSINNTRHRQIVDAIKNNPEFLNGMKKQLTSIFEDVLEKRGIPKSSVGMSTMDYSKKAGILKQERQQKASKLPNFWDIRQQYIGEVDHLAKQRLQEDRKNKPQAKNSLSSSAPLPRSVPRPQSGAQSGSPGPRQAAVQRSHSHPPKPSPRGTINKPTAGQNRGSNDYSQGSETVTGSQWESDEEEDASEEEETETDDETYNKYPQSPARQNQQSPARTTGQGQKPVARPVATTTTSKKVVTTKTTTQQSESYDDGDSEDDSWGDDISELKDVTDPETPRPKPSKNQPQMRGSTPGTPNRGRGQNVARLSATIEEQLHGRSSKKPAGAVDVMDKNSNKQNQGAELESDSEEESDDESLPTISDVDDKPKPNVRQAATRSSTHTDYSTNTYGTSAWGSGSKAASTVHGNQTRASVNKSVSKASTSGDVDGSDWDDSGSELQVNDL